ncbi:MAG: DNA methyltransferase [Thermomicrobiales bacterium]
MAAHEQAGRDRVVADERVCPDPVPHSPPTSEYPVHTPHSNGRHDPRNQLNDLTGREWLYFLSSVITTAYPVTGPGSYGHNLRRAHPSPKPPQLMAPLIEFFTRRGGRVLDPFAGVGGTLLGCALTGRTGVGIDLAAEYRDVYRAVCAQEELTEQPFLIGDARLLGAEPLPACLAAPFDLVLTDPPYGEMLSRPQAGEKRKRTGRADPTPFTTDPADLGNLPRAAFLAALAEIIGLALTRLRPGGHLILFAKDLQPTAEHHNLLHADIVTHFAAALPQLRFRGYKLWVDRTVNLYPFGYPYGYVANQLHQYILIWQLLPRS